MASTLSQIRACIYLMHRHGLQQVGRLSVANVNIHTANGYPATQGAQRVRFPKLTSPDLIPTKRNEIWRNTRKAGRSVGNPPYDPCPPAQLTWRNYEQISKPENPV